MQAVDQADSAQFTRDDILSPQRWVLLNFLMDSRTGLGRFRHFRISNYDLMMQLIEHCRDHTIEQIIDLPDVQERVDLYIEHNGRFVDQVRDCTNVYGRLALLDLRNQATIYAGNRFTIYAVFPQCDISVHLMWGMKQQNTVFAVGKSILDRTSPVDVGAICLRYGGGGHPAAGTCQVANDQAEAVKDELIAALSPPKSKAVA
jgi:nanoRNase/pAp phosphatase (c-di-AMP/oligoRNAs hydrolase)